jgi:hypothetical protein
MSLRQLFKYHNTLTSYLTLSGATFLYPTNGAVSNTLTSYLTLSNANSTYAPKANPTFTGNVTSSGVITGAASNGNAGWASWQILAARVGSSSAYVRAIRPIDSVEVGYSWANASDSGNGALLNRWLCFMPPGVMTFNGILQHLVCP